MMKALMAGAALMLAALPGAAAAQEGETLDCVALSVPGDIRESIGEAMAGGGEEASREALFPELARIPGRCVQTHRNTDKPNGPTLEHTLPHISPNSQHNN